MVGSTHYLGSYIMALFKKAQVAKAPFICPASNP